MTKQAFVREYTPADLGALKQIHASNGNEFTLPRLDNPLVLIKRVLDDGGPRVICLGRLHISALLFIDRTYKEPKDRLEAIRTIQGDMMNEAGKYGLDIATTQAGDRFAERLEKDLGWTRGYGTMFYRGIVDAEEQNK